MTNEQARKILHELENRGSIENCLTMEQIYAIRVAQGALDDSAETKRLLSEMLKVMNDGSCAKDCKSCKYVIGGCDYQESFEWKHTDEVVKLIGGEDG